MDGIAKKIAISASDSAKKISDFASLSRLNEKLAAANRDLEKQLEKLGAMFYSNCKGSPPIEYVDAFAAVDACKASIAAIQAEIDSYKETKACPACGAVCAEGQQFCDSCGVSLKGTPEEGVQFCDKCGTKLSAAAVFCTECGNKLKN